MVKIQKKRIELNFGILYAYLFKHTVLIVALFIV